MRRRQLLAAVPAAVTVGLAGCTNGGEDTPTSSPTATDAATDSPTPTPADSPTPTPSRTPTAAPTATGTPTETGTPTPAADLTVAVGPGGDLRFEPETFAVAVGDTVRWRWESAGHNVSPGSQPSGASWQGDDASTYPAGHTHAHTFTAAGAYEYHCDPHQSVGMVGSFTVE